MSSAPDRIRTSASREGERCHRFEPWRVLDAPDRTRTSASPEGERCHRFEPWRVLDAPDRTRTCDLVLRRHALYPTELRAPRPSLALPVIAAPRTSAVPALPHDAGTFSPAWTLVD